jgi:hypothetical protein
VIAMGLGSGDPLLWYSGRYHVWKEPAASGEQPA